LDPTHREDPVTDPDDVGRRPHVVVVGGGISGLAAAWRLATLRHDVDITVLEGSDVVGGKLRVSEIDGIAVDEGAESMIATRPEAVALAREIGLGDDLVHPAVTAPSLFLGGDLVPLPPALMMGVPTDLSSLARSGVISAQGLARIPLDHVLPPTRIGEDISIGEYVGRRLGPEVVVKLVAPLLMGVYADRPVNISMRVAAPSLFEAATHDRSLLEAAKSARAKSSAASSGGPVFAGIRGGVGRFPLVLAERLRAAGVTIATGVTVRDVVRAPRGWRVETGATNDVAFLDADAVILAVPAPVAAKLATGLSVQAEAELSELDVTSVAVVTHLYRASELPGGDVPGGSGYLTPSDVRRPVKAATFASHKWQWIADEATPRGLVAVRCSMGLADDVELLQRDDDDLARLAADDLAFAARLGKARPVASRVTRWGGGLPRYAVGHVDRATRIVDALQSLPGMAVCGAAYDGVGIAACIGRADKAATHISQGLGSHGGWRHG
jgi:oxygen-dependent protoporphyrinogen oxidase